MSCNECLFRNDLCKPGEYLKGSIYYKAPLLYNEIINKGYLEFNDRELYKILEQSNCNSVCYVDYALFIYEKYKNEKRFSLSYEIQPAIKSIVDLLYASFGDPESPDNIFQKLYVKNTEKKYNKTLDKTETDATVKKRIGQELFKRKLLMYDPKCKICGLNMRSFLIASHIKDWTFSNNIERIDVYNGFLMCPQHDSLFDKGYISFDDAGKILISSKIAENNYSLFNINPNIKINIEEEHKKYLKWNIKNRFME
jgi:predicted restriction endonuclease